MWPKYPRMTTSEVNNFIDKQNKSLKSWWRKHFTKPKWFIIGSTVDKVCCRRFYTMDLRSEEWPLGELLKDEQLHFFVRTRAKAESLCRTMDREYNGAVMRSWMKG